MNAILRALRDFLAVRPADVASAVVGGIAVSVRAEPRFTRDLDLAVAVANDDEAAIELIQQRGFSRGRDLRAGLAEIRALADE